MMDTSISAETARLAGLQTDMLQKIRNGQITFSQFEWWLNQSSEVRDRHMQSDFQDVVRGLSQIVAIEHVIDCDADPFIPKGWTVENHKKGGMFKWDAPSIKLYLSENQQGDKCIKGDDLRKELAKEPVLNANVLDYLLKHPELIPGDWKGKAIFFWGTIYRGSGGILYVRYLYWDGDHWDWDYRWLGRDFDCGSPAACSQVSN